MTGNCYINRNKKHNENYDRELLHQHKTKKHDENYDRELLH